MKKHLMWGLAAILGVGSGTAGADQGDHPLAGGHVQWSARLPLPPSFPNDRQNLRELAGTEDPDSPDDDNGQTLQYDDLAEPPSTEVMAAFANRYFYRQFDRYHRTEGETDQYYWHNYRGRRICHYVDDRNEHWIGFTVGEDDPQWAMLLWRDGRFWWHDTANDRWVFYYRNNWWSPIGSGSYPYQVYLQGRYFSCDQYGRILPALEPGAEDRPRDHRDHDVEERTSWRDEEKAETLQPTPDPDDSTYYDQAKSRMIKITGPDRKAYLYDTTPDHTLDHVLLCGQVTDVEFDTDAEGKAWRITLAQQNGKKRLYDQTGHFIMEY